MLVRLSLITFLVLASCISEPADPVVFGQICVPSTGECPSEVLLERNAVGRNQLDYTIENKGGSEAAVRMAGVVPVSETEDAGIDDAATAVAVSVIVERTHRVPAGETQGNRWTPQNLGTRPAFTLQAQCLSCSVDIDYVLTSVPLECIQDSECTSGWFCDTVVPGRCVECRENTDCDVDQRCDDDLGRCTPPKDTSGCNVASGPLAPLTMLFVLFLLVGVRQRKWLAGFAVALIVGAAAPSPAAAEAPVASLSIGGGARTFTGELRDHTDVGLGLTLSQELRWKYIGEAVRLDVSYFLATPEAPPYSNDFRTTSVTIGPRGYIPIQDWQIVFGADYVRFGLSSNSLIRLTGAETSFNGAAAVLGGRFQWSGLEARAELGYQHLFGLPGAMITFDLAVALSTAF